MQYICEYSVKEDQFYVTPSSLVYATNSIAVTCGEKTDVIPFAECDSYDDGFRLCDQMRTKVLYARVAERKEFTIICSGLKEGLSAKIYLESLIDSASENGTRAAVYIMQMRGGIISLGRLNISADIVEKIAQHYAVLPQNPKQIVARFAGRNGTGARGGHDRRGMPSRHKKRRNKQRMRGKLGRCRQ